MKGVIFVNTFLLPKESVLCAEKLQEEFTALGVETKIEQFGNIGTFLENDTLKTKYSSFDFGVFLDKNKYLSNILSKSGLKLFNKHEAIRVCDDKGETYIALSDCGVKMPNTVFGSLCYDKNAVIDKNEADFIIDKLHLPVVVKESFGSMGKGVYLAENKTQLLEIMEKLKLKPHLYQEYIGYKKGTDIRVIVIGKKAIGAIKRQNDNDFRSNVALGGVAEKIVPREEFMLLAEKVASILNLDYCGVDLLFGKNGEPVLCEVNSNAFFLGFSKATNINVAKIYAEYIINKVKE